MDNNQYVHGCFDGCGRSGGRRAAATPGPLPRHPTRDADHMGGVRLPCPSREREDRKTNPRLLLPVPRHETRPDNLQAPPPLAGEVYVVVVAVVNRTV